MFRYIAQPKDEGRRRVNRSRPGLESLEHRVTPSTFHVNSLLDTVAVNLKTGKDASGHVSLRSAIEAADAKPNADTIIVPAGTITLTIAGANENKAATGDLDIHGNVTIKGERRRGDHRRRQQPRSRLRNLERQGVDQRINDPARPRWPAAAGCSTGVGKSR